MVLNVRAGQVVFGGKTVVLRSETSLHANSLLHPSERTHVGLAQPMLVNPPPQLCGGIATPPTYAQRRDPSRHSDRSCTHTHTPSCKPISDTIHCKPRCMAHKHTISMRNTAHSKHAHMCSQENTRTHTCAHTFRHAHSHAQRHQHACTRSSSSRHKRRTGSHGSAQHRTAQIVQTRAHNHASHAHRCV